MKLKAAMKELEGLGIERMRKMNAKNGASENQFGVQMGDIRKIAKRIKIDHDLALELWETGNEDARFLAILVMDPKLLSAKELNALVRSLTFTHVSMWLENYVIKKHDDKEALRVKWMKVKHAMAARAGWALSAERVAKDPDGLDMVALLDRIESEMAAAPTESQWTMNVCLVEIGIHFPKHRKGALKIGKTLGVYSDWPEVKGCTSPYAPIWIDKMVRQKAK